MSTEDALLSSWTPGTTEEVLPEFVVTYPGGSLAGSETDVHQEDASELSTALPQEALTDDLPPPVELLPSLDQSDHGRLVPLRPINGQADFKPVASMRGVVTEVRSNSFIARIERGPLERDAEADFDLDEVSEFDRELLVPGATFYWTIGYRRKRSGTRSESGLFFRRLPRYSARDIAETEERVEALKEFYGWD